MISIESRNAHRSWSAGMQLPCNRAPEAACFAGFRAIFRGVIGLSEPQPVHTRPPSLQASGFDPVRFPSVFHDKVF